MSPRTVIPARELVEIKAPYVLRNQTGLRLMVVVDGHRLRTDDESRVVESTSALSLGATKPKTGLVKHIIDVGENIGFFDVSLNKAVRN